MGESFLDSDREIDSDPIYLPRAIGGRPRETGDISGAVFPATEQRTNSRRAYGLFG